MDCQTAQNELLSAQSLTLLGPELSAHLAECADCQALLARLRALDVQTKSLPVPAGHEQPRPEFMQKLLALAEQTQRPIRHFIRRAIAAAIVLAFGLAAASLIFFNGSTVQADMLIGQLVDWNLAIAHTTDTASRTRVYQQQLQQLQKEVQQAHLASAEAHLATALLNNAQWMTTEENHTEEAQHFQNIASELLARQQTASGGAAAHYQQMYQELINESVSAAPASVPASPATQSRAGVPASRIRFSSSLVENLQTPSPQAAAADVLGALPEKLSTSASGRLKLSGRMTGSRETSALYSERGSAGLEDASSRIIDAHSHHIAQRSSSVEAPAVSNQSGRTSVAPASATGAATPVRTTDSAVNSPPAPPPAPPSDPCPAGAQPPLGSLALGRFISSTDQPLDLQNAAGLGPPPHWRLAPAFSAGGELPDNSDGAISGVNLMMEGSPPSREQIEQMLESHVDRDWSGPGDMTMRPPPPPMFGEGRPFSGDNDLAPTVAFPEPATVAALPAVLLLTRRRRRL